MRLLDAKTLAKVRALETKRNRILKAAQAKFDKEREKLQVELEAKRQEQDARGQWTGRQLAVFLDSLSSVDLDKPVELEGCDCSGECFGAKIAGGTIYLERRS